MNRTYQYIKDYKYLFDPSKCNMIKNYHRLDNNKIKDNLLVDTKTKYTKECYNLLKKK